MNPITLAVLRAIKQLTEQQHGQPPTLRELVQEAPGRWGKEASVATIHRHVQKLAKLGLVVHTPHIARGLVLTAKGKEEASKHDQ